MEKNRYERAINAASRHKHLNQRSWSFRTCGWGHGHEFWKPFVSMLRRQGYDKVLSIEHEDALMSIEEGLQRAIEFLSEAIIFEEPATPWWT